MEKHLLTEISKTISQGKNVGENISDICETYYNQPVHSLQDLKNRNTKLKGDIFENVCYLYMKHCYPLQKVYYLKDVPQDIREKLNLSKNDMGIDFIGVDKDGEYYAIQAKYRKRTKSKTMVTWKQLSTFYALALKTGPYKKHIIFTNADYVRHVGKKTEKDETIGYNRLVKTEHWKWLSIINSIDLPVNIVVDKPQELTQDELRKKRLEFYGVEST